MVDWVQKLLVHYEGEIVSAAPIVFWSMVALLVLAAALPRTSVWARRLGLRRRPLVWAGIPLLIIGVGCGGLVLVAACAFWLGYLGPEQDVFVYMLPWALAPALAGGLALVLARRM